MSIKELRKQFPAPFALSVLKRALELNPEKPDMETASKEYAEEMKKRPTRYDFYFVAPSGIAQISADSVSVEIEKYQPIYHLIAVQARLGKLEQKTLNELMAIYGEHIKIHPTKTFALKGSLNNFFDISHYVSIVGVDTVPAIPRSELTDEILKTLAKNILCCHMDYVAIIEGEEHKIEYLKKYGDMRDFKTRHRIDEARKKIGEMPPFEEFVLNHTMEFGDSIVARTYSVFYSGKTIREYLKIATKKLADTLRIPITEIKITQCEVHDLKA